MATQIRHKGSYTIHQESWRSLPDQSAETTGKVLDKNGSMRRFVAWMPANLETVTVAFDDNTGRACAWTLDEAIHILMGKASK